MKLMAAGLSIIICVISQTASAKETTHRDMGVSFKNFNGLYIRKALSESTMIYTGIGYRISQSYSASDSGVVTSSRDSTNTVYSFAVGARKYFNIDTLSKFINLEVGRNFNKYVSSTNSSTTGSSSTEYQTQNNSANITYGIEYYISSNISIEGAAGLGMNWSEDNIPAYAYTNSKEISFPLVNIALTYYW